MRNTKLNLLFFAGVMFFSMAVTGCDGKNAGTSGDVQAVDAIYTNATFFTEDEALPEASVMAVKDGKIVYVGDNADGFTGETVDLGGAFVTPTFMDAHTHPGNVATTVWYEDMPADCDTKEEILDYVGDYCAKHPVSEIPYMYFEYYPSNLFDENGPRKEWIDEVVSDRPILIEDFSDHACWVNSKFLELLGVYEEGVVSAEDEPFFIKDDAGEYTGWIKEFVWKNYIDNLYTAINWSPDDSVSEENLLFTLKDFSKWGITGVMDAIALDENHVAVVSEMMKNGKWNGYYELSVVMEEPDDLEETLDKIHNWEKTYGSDKCHIDTLKIFYDGTNELGDAALIDGWITDPSQKGYIMMSTEETAHVIRRCNEEGIDVHFHMVGDLAFRQVMDATEMLLDELGSLDIQVEVCHCEYVSPADYERPGKLGVIVNWTPHWSGGYFGDGSLQYLGEERYNNMYQFNPMIESGATVTFGSDIYSAYEEQRANPYFSMQIGMTRVDIDCPMGMRESEAAKLSLSDLLKGYTINAAVQLGIDDRTGSLSVGKDASFNVFDTDLFAVDEFEFKDILPVAVYYEGKRID